MISRAFLAGCAFWASLAGFAVAGIADEAKEIRILRPASIGESQRAFDVLKRALAA